MKTDSPDIELNEADKDLLRRAESNSGKPWRTLLREVLAPILGPQPSSLAAWQRKNGIELFKRLENNPVTHPMMASVQVLTTTRFCMEANERQTRTNGRRMEPLGRGR